VLTGQRRCPSFGLRIRVRYPNMLVDSNKPSPSQPLIQGFRVLQAFSATEPALTLRQVACRAGLDSGTAFHLVQTLVILGYIERISGSKQFRLTLKPLELGFHAIVQNRDSISSSHRVDNRSRRSE
jgi:DNA-binding IclR family transcriptional regulator